MEIRIATSKLREISNDLENEMDDELVIGLLKKLNEEIGGKGNIK